MNTSPQNLTDAICATAVPRTKEYTVKDSGFRGLQLRVQPCGGRSWIVRTRKDGKQLKHTLGRYPDVPIKTARQLAAAVLADGKKAPGATRKKMPTFREFHQQHAARKASGFKTKWCDAYEVYCRTQLLPAFGHMRLDEIDAPAINAWMARYSANAPGGANRAFDILRGIFTCAYDWQVLDKSHHNPCHGVRKNKRQAVGTYLSEAQYLRLGSVLQQHEQQFMAARVIRFLMITGCRVGEVIDLEWRDVRPNHLALRDSKTGPKTLPIGAGAVQYLDLQKALLEQDDPARQNPSHNPNAVFPLPKLRSLRGHIRGRWDHIKQEANLPEKVRLHDLRHSFASYGLTHGKSLQQVQRLLGHSDIETTERYAHLNDDALAAAAEKVGGWIMEIIQRE